MATIALGADISTLLGTNFVYDFINTLRNSPAIVPGSTEATATWSQTLDDGMGGTVELDSIVTFHGTSLETSDGVITGMDFSYEELGSIYQAQVATGLGISSESMLAAITAASGGDTSALKAVFQGINWTVDARPGTTDEQFFFQGTGGGDTVTFGKSKDEVALDGGNDTIKLGGNSDTVTLGTALLYSEPGLTKINGGAGEDMLELNGQTQTSTPLVQHGIKINMNKTIKLDDFSIQIQNVEHVVGTQFTDTIVGTAKADIIDGGGGGDLIIGGGGADTLISTQGVDDFFTYTKDTDSGPGKSRDTIFGFEHKVDVIDLHKLNPDTKAHQFHFIGDDPLKRVGDLDVVFHNEPGSSNDYYLVQANLDSDKAAELQIKIAGDVNLTKVDFML